MAGRVELDRSLPVRHLRHHQAAGVRRHPGRDVQHHHRRCLRVTALPVHLPRQRLLHLRRRGHGGGLVGGDRRPRALQDAQIHVHRPDQDPLLLARARRGALPGRHGGGHRHPDGGRALPQRPARPDAGQLGSLLRLPLHRRDHARHDGTDPCQHHAHGGASLLPDRRGGGRRALPLQRRDLPARGPARLAPPHRVCHAHHLLARTHAPLAHRRGGAGFPHAGAIHQPATHRHPARFDRHLCGPIRVHLPLV
ncbi:MAG: hypothetical protein MZV64_00025 [Ignavibacteriales bacterium]|nr:hypothetical protein [Ignavibacteriales bacterium]